MATIDFRKEKQKRIKPTKIKSCYGGIQKIYQFENCYGASVIKCKASKGGEKGLWELAVCSAQTPEGNWELDYSTEITSNVEGHLSEEDVQTLLQRIRRL